MADGELTLKLDEETARRLQAAADAAGRPVSDYASELIADGLAWDDDGAEDVRLAAESDRTGVSYSVEEAMAHFRSELHAQVKKSP
jgi:predicted transcriptional regulator